MARIKTIDVIALALQIDGHILTSAGPRHSDFGCEHELPMLQWPTRLGEFPQEKTINQVLARVEDDYQVRLFSPNLSQDYHVLQGKNCAIRIRLLTAHIEADRTLRAGINTMRTLETNNGYHFVYYRNAINHLPIWVSVIYNKDDIIRRVKL